MSREASPFSPGRRAMLEWIRQDLYSSGLTGTTLAPISFFAVAQGASAGNFTNMETPNAVQNPKVFRWLGIRIHIQQSAVARVVENTATLVSTSDAANILESYFLTTQIGPKQYVQAPLFALPSGFGLWFSGTMTGTNANPIQNGVNANGVPSFNNFMKFGRKVITLVPNQNFQVVANLGTATSASVAVTTRLWCFLVGILGRETL